jgi:ATP-dependent DNA ligase
MLNYKKFLEMEPGKYWKLPENKKHEIDKYMIDKNYLAMIKYDGVWARVIVAENGIIIQSRGISVVTNTYGEYQNKVPHIVKELIENYPVGTVLLGEICYPNLKKDANKVGSVIRCLDDKAVALQEKEEDKLHLYIFDCLAYNGEEVINNPFWSRISGNWIKGGNYVHKALLGIDARKLLESVWDDGGEGIILIKKDEPYNIGKPKAWHSIKVKRELGEIESLVIAFVEPNKEYAGDDPHWTHRDNNGDLVTKAYAKGWKAGVTVNYDGRIINITSGLTDEDAEYLSTPEAEEIMKAGKLVAVFTGMSLTPDSIRHPRLIKLRDEA